jgi:hypothetical protein
MNRLILLSSILLLNTVYSQISYSSSYVSVTTQYHMYACTGEVDYVSYQYTNYTCVGQQSYVNLCGSDGIPYSATCVPEDTGTSKLK